MTLQAIPHAHTPTPGSFRASRPASHVTGACSRWALAAVCLGSNATAWAHEGHGLSGPHAHATDVWGFIAVGLIVAIAVWRGRR